MFRACMAKYCDVRQHELSQLSHLWDGVWELYSKAQDEAKTPALEREVDELRQKLAEVTRVCDVLGHQLKKVPRLEAEVADLKHANNVQLRIHQADVESNCAEVQRLSTQLEAKDAFCDAEKNRMLAKLHANY